LDFGFVSSCSQKHLGIEAPFFRSFFGEAKKGQRTQTTKHT